MSHYYRAGDGHVSYKSNEYELSVDALVEVIVPASIEYDA